MIANLKTVLKSLKLEWFIKRSFIYDIYLNLFYKYHIQKREKEINFYRKLLKSNSVDLIFDIGASGGDKAHIFSKISSRIVCLEPDKTCYEILVNRFKNKAKSIMIINKAVAESSGDKTFFAVNNGSAYNTLSERWAINISKKVEIENGLDVKKYSVQTITLDELISRYGLPYFIKIDIEGYEINAIMGLSSKVPFITFELNLPDFKDEGIKCIDRLCAIDPNALFNFFVDFEKGLDLPENICGDKFKRLLVDTDLEYMEVLCQMNCSSDYT